jgi:hypothetical protein
MSKPFTGLCRDRFFFFFMHTKHFEASILQNYSFCRPFSMYFLNFNVFL